MYLVLIIGMTNEGKSYFTKQYLSKARRVLAFDVNNEYCEGTGKGNKGSEELGTCYPLIGLDDEIPDKARFYGKPQDFLALSKEVTNTHVVFEEATGFFKGRISQDMTEQIIGKAHTGNQYIFLFHSIQRTPKELFELANYCVLFRTGDIEDDVKRKAPRILPAFKKLQKAAPRSKTIIKLI